MEGVSEVITLGEIIELDEKCVQFQKESFLDQGVIDGEKRA